MMGAAIIFMLTSGLVRIGIPGYLTSAIIGVILLLAVGFDVKWAKNRGKVMQKIYVNPGLFRFTCALNCPRQRLRVCPKRPADGRAAYRGRPGRRPRRRYS